MNIICWDFDGTLAYAKSLWSHSVLHALLAVDRHTTVSLEAVRAHMMTGFPWHTPEADHMGHTGEAWWTYMERHFYASYIALGVMPTVANAACCKVRGIVKRIENYTVYPGAMQTLQTALDKGYTNVLLSNNYPELQETVDGLGLGQFFDSVVVSGAIGFNKPRQEIFTFTKSLYAGAKQFIMVGDSVEADIQGGKNAGMETVLIHQPQHVAADFCFDRLEDICSIL